MPGSEAKYPDELTRQRYMVESFNKERDTRLRWYFNVSKPKQAESGEQVSKQYEVMLRRLQASCPKPTEELLRLRGERESQENLSERDEGGLDGGRGNNGGRDCQLPKISNTVEFTPDTRFNDVTSSVSLPPITTGSMYRVDDAVLGQIYSGSSREEKGRYAYLKARRNVLPENKYNYPVVSSWEYGWRLRDVIKVEDLKNPEHGRSRIVADTFYRNNLDGLSHKI